MSVGENSTVFISNIKTKNNNVGIAVKDGSNAEFDYINFEKIILTLSYSIKNKSF